MGVTLERAKQHLRVTSTAEDDLIELYIGAASDWIRNYLDDGEFVPDEFAVNAAQLLIIGDLYDIREAQSAGVEIKQNPAVERLLFPYRKNIGV